MIMFRGDLIMTTFKPVQFIGQMRQNLTNNDIYTIVAWEDGKFLVEYEDEDNSQYRYSKEVVFGDKVVEV